MKTTIKSILCGIALFCSMAGWTQRANGEKLAIKAHTNISLNNAIDLDSPIDGIDNNSSCNDFGIDFGWTFLHKNNHSLEANIGIGYRAASVKMEVENLDYHYSAPADADMDGEKYIRYYEIDNLSQKSTFGRFEVPLYLSYAYKCNNRLSVHADLGFSLGFNVSTKLSSLTGEGYSYGVYPQYDNLKIDESYMNSFGRSNYTKEMGGEPHAKSFSCSILAGIGAEFKIYGPLAADLSFRYTRGLTNLYEPASAQGGNFNASNSPITYSVKDGQQIKSLTDYLTTSKLSLISLDISLIYRF